MAPPRKLKEGEVTFTIDCDPETFPVRGNAMASGDAEFDKECEDDIIEQLDQGNQWAWCVVTVTAHWKDFSGKDYLGGCSYRNQEEFKEDGYYSSMKEQALDDLNATIFRQWMALKPLMEGE